MLVVFVIQITIIIIQRRNFPVVALCQCIVSSSMTTTFLLPSLNLNLPGIPVHPTIYPLPRFAAFPTGNKTADDADAGTNETGVERDVAADKGGRTHA